ncbi:MAG: AAA family ATPase [Lachnospiraceae bacterium]|nr:AAA family ATPase [Lachnospiraceae bacterium]MDD3615031.1 AAA family ATPase [Lachnospiraceae bacterium]
METSRKLPIGIEDFEKIRTQDFYYVDKTGLIKELLENWGEVNLFTRPRRFGKSLNMSMLKYFFSYGCNPDVFTGLDIEKEQILCEKYMGKFPVISITLKGVAGDTFEAARDMLCAVIRQEALRFQCLLASKKLSQKDKEIYNQLTQIDNVQNGSFIMSDSTLVNSLLNLSVLLNKHYEQKVIILIDEYDVPLDKAFQFNYYDQMVNMIRNLFNQTLKSNENLFFSVLTGCLRISKESIFTGLNNPKVLSITDVRFDEYFGFVDEEVKQMLDFYNLNEHYVKTKEWYDGYRFGNVDVYCPWDVICYIDELRANPNAQPKDYWTNTSGNDIVRRFIHKARNSTTKREIEQLLVGETITKEIHMELTYKDLDKTLTNLWSVLFTTGYLTQSELPNGDEFTLRIPNLEIRKIFTKQIYSWFQEEASKDGDMLNTFCDAFKTGDVITAEQLLNKYLVRTISIRDTFVQKPMKENFYHGILLGLFAYKNNWDVSSNKESGEGYSDILIEIEDEDTGIVIEIKYPDSNNLELGCMNALNQIEKRHYDEQLRNNGITKIWKYGIACYGKQCRIVVK